MWVVLTIVFFTAVMVFGAGGISAVLTALVGGGVAESYIYPLYAGIILLAGLITVCTLVVTSKIKELEKNVTAERSKEQKQD